MDIIEDIKPLSFFKQKTGNVVKHIKATKKPTFITVNGNVELVIQDAKSYQNMINFIEEIKNKTKINEGLNDIKTDNIKSAEEVFNKIENKYDL